MSSVHCVQTNFVSDKIKVWNVVTHAGPNSIYRVHWYIILYKFASAGWKTMAPFGYWDMKRAKIRVYPPNSSTYVLTQSKIMTFPVILVNLRWGRKRYLFKEYPPATGWEKLVTEYLQQTLKDSIDENNYVFAISLHYTSLINTKRWGHLSPLGPHSVLKCFWIVRINSPAPLKNIFI